eukprot:Skav224799  [mRNA]  locus=scaffold764:625709:626310:+ [translate_table: standard]
MAWVSIEFSCWEAKDLEGVINENPQLERQPSPASIREVFRGDRAATELVESSPPAGYHGSNIAMPGGKELAGWKGAALEAL